MIYDSRHECNLMARRFVGLALVTMPTAVIDPCRRDAVEDICPIRRRQYLRRLQASRVYRRSSRYGKVMLRRTLMKLKVPAI